MKDVIKLLGGLLIFVGLIFGTFTNFQTNTPLGWTWFVNNLWFAIGLPVLFLIAYAVIYIGIDAIEKAVAAIE